MKRSWPRTWPGATRAGFGAHSDLLSLPIIRPLGSCSTPDVFVMKPTDARQLHHPSLVRPLDSPMLGCVLSQGQMCPGPVVVVNVLRQDPAKMPFANHDDVVKAFPSNRANHPLGIRVLPPVNGAR